MDILHKEKGWSIHQIQRIQSLDQEPHIEEDPDLSIR